MALAQRKYDITANHGCFAGVRKVLQWTIRDEDDAAVDITGFEFRFVIREKGDVDKKVVKELDNTAFSIITPASGIVQMVIPGADMPAHGEYTYWLMATDDEEDVASYGSFLVRPGPGT